GIEQTLRLQQGASARCPCHDVLVVRECTTPTTRQRRLCEESFYFARKLCQRVWLRRPIPQARPRHTRGHRLVLVGGVRRPSGHVPVPEVPCSPWTKSDSSGTSRRSHQRASGPLERGHRITRSQVEPLWPYDPM